jgi:hypothetical protein
MKKISLVIVALTLIGCSATHNIAKKSKTQKYLERKIENNHRQFAIVNNQIIMFENIN